jgi:hypothetical protein
MQIVRARRLTERAHFGHQKENEQQSPEKTMRSVVLILPAAALLAGCGTSSSEQAASRIDTYNQMRAQLGDPASPSYLNSLDGEFVYTGVGLATVGSVDTVHSAKVTANFNAGASTDNVSGLLYDFVPVDGEGSGDTRRSFDGQVELQTTNIGAGTTDANAAAGTADGRLTLTTGTGTNAVDQIFVITGTYDMTFTNSATGQPAEYIDGTVTTDPGSNNFSSTFVVQQR